MRIGARASPLSRKQVEEVEFLLGAVFQKVFIEVWGDRERGRSLRGMEKTDFFTRELDEMVLRGEVDAAVHSAKDLPEVLPEGLEVAAITKGLDGRDALVMRQPLFVVATSSERREEEVRKLFPGVAFRDLRGTIGERLAIWERGEVDGVVVAEAALIRLSLTHLPRLFLPGPPLQGRLAIVTRKGKGEPFWRIDDFKCGA